MPDRRVVNLAQQLVAWEREHRETNQAAGLYYWFAQKLVEREDAVVAREVRSVLDEALNSGDGAYRP